MDKNQVAQGSAVLTLNAGSSSIKFSLYVLPQLIQLAVGQVEGVGSAPLFKVKLPSSGSDMVLAWGQESEPINHQQALSEIIAWIHQEFSQLEIVAIGHRVVHGGQKYTKATLIDDELMQNLEEFVGLAPLHMPHNLFGIKLAREQFGAIPQIACFDTAFHRVHSFVDDCYALPREFYDKGICRYGFHGLSYEYIAEKLMHLFPKEFRGKTIVAHLGNGASMTALRDGVSIASTMGFSSLDGLPMGTRCGEIDPGVLLYMMQHEGMDARQISDILYKKSGLLGLSGGISSDMRTLEVSEAKEAKEALDYYVREIKREIGALTALLSGLDVLVFTGGIGENSVLIRSRVLENMSWLGIKLDEDSNQNGETIISADDSKVLCLKMHTDEERVIARHTYDIFKQSESISA